MKKMTTEHLSIAAFRPKTLANVLAFPEGSYKFPRTESVEGNPHARKLLFSKFKLVSKLHEIKAKMQKHRIYDGFDIDVSMNAHKTLEITLVMRNKKTESLDIPNTVISNDKQERRDVISIVKKAINAKIGVDYESYRSLPLKNGVSIIFFNYVHITKSCYQLAKTVEKQLHYYDVRCFVNGDGLVINCTKRDTHNLDVPFGLKKLPPTVEVQPIVENIPETVVETVETVAQPVEQTVVETVTEYLSLSEQINKTVKELRVAGRSIKDIKTHLGCSDAEMLELLDVNNTTLFKHVEKLARLNNTSFVI
jgi:hypothetical protein